jgi:hypothetical protein
MTKEEIRLAESGTRKKHWKRWGPYLSERAWGTVREDYSRTGTHGNTYRTITPVRALIAGTRTAWPGSVIGGR